MEARFVFEAPVGARVTFSAKTADDAPALLDFRFDHRAANQANLSARSLGQPMATDAVSSRAWSRRDQPSGTAVYKWRYRQVRNLWDDLDRAEIGSDYAKLEPFATRKFQARLVVTDGSQQIWLDGRLIAEARVQLPADTTMSFDAKTTGQAIVHSQGVDAPVDTGPFLPIELGYYRHERGLPEGRGELVGFPVPWWGTAPMYVWMPNTARVELDLGQSLYRYRRSFHAGPDTSYVKATVSYPSPLEIDPRSFTFRVPYRDYQNAYLLVYDSGEPGSVPAGVLRFYREGAGYPASSYFEVSDAAIHETGLVLPLDEKTPDGKPMYHIRVPLDTAGLYGLRDMHDQFLDLEITKPTHLVRSYPDPIYYGHHPGGPPSSLRVLAVTLETAPLSHEVKPDVYGHLFERPRQPGYVVAVTNHQADGPLHATVILSTTSRDGSEQHTLRQPVEVPAGQTREARFDLSVERLGWHRLRVRVQEGLCERVSDLAFVALPPNSRTYGNSKEETRFGAWVLFGHYTPLVTNPQANEPWLAMLRALGIRGVAMHRAYIDADLAKKYDLLPRGGHTYHRVAHRGDPDNPEELQEIIDYELKMLEPVMNAFERVTYFYGGEWNVSLEAAHGEYPQYTGDPRNSPRKPSDAETAKVVRQTKIFTALGQAIRARYGDRVKLILQWGSPKGTIPFLEYGFPKELVDGFGVDKPIFEIVPEVPTSNGGLNDLWTVRAEARRLGWPEHDFYWCEGPFLNTNPGALTEQQQADHYVRLYLMGLAYGLEQFEAGVVPDDAGNYYGAEHYGAGVYHRVPLSYPKPAVATIATATAMLCGAKVVGPIDTGQLTTYCLAFEKNGKPLYALWRVRGEVTAELKYTGGSLLVTDADGNASSSQSVPPGGAATTVRVSPSPVWITGIDALQGITLGEPEYAEQPAPHVVALPAFSLENWKLDTSVDPAYESHHFAVRRVAEPELQVTFGQSEHHGPTADVTLPTQPGDRPLAIRYAQFVPGKPIAIPGKASALGLWIRGNSSWGRVVYQVRDAKGELWTSVGTKNNWNCDDTHGWSMICFEGWRYVRFPLPGNLPYDDLRETEITWWGSPRKDGDPLHVGVVDQPLTLEKIYLEARNEVIVLGQMRTVPDRTYQLAGLVAEYDSADDMTDAALARYERPLPVPDWQGPDDNPIARLAADGLGEGPIIRAFDEPGHWNDGRRMIIRFDAQPEATYKLYLSRYPDGRGADVLHANVKDQQLVVGFRPETTMYLFLTRVTADGQESRPSPPYELVTHDKFAEK